jgi:hypothetical protein
MNGYVYLIGSPEFGWYKIGKSRRPNIRVKELGILLPFEIETIGVWCANDYSYLEVMLHEKYRGQRINGEWFKFDVKHLASVFDDMLGVRRIVPASDVIIPWHLRQFCPKGSIDRKTHGKQLHKLFNDRMNEILTSQNVESTPETRKIARKIVEQEIRSAKKATTQPILEPLG